MLPPLGCGAAILLCSSPQVHQQPVFQRVDGLVGVEPREARLALSLGLGVNGRQGQEVVLVTEAPDGPDVEKRPLWSYLDSQEKEGTHGDDDKEMREQDRAAFTPSA